MATYTNRNEINGKELKVGDTVIFSCGDNIHRYIVCDKHLDKHFSSSMNHVVFRELGLIEIAKKDFCTIHYGYLAVEGDWPECRYGDMTALTALVKVLLTMVEQKFGKPVILSTPLVYKAGMRVVILSNCNECKKDEVYTLVEDKTSNGTTKNSFCLRAGDCVNGCACIEKWKLVENYKQEEIEMELKEIKKANLVEAAKQIAAEKINAEITFAKDQLRNAQNQIDSYDRQIKQIEDYKKPYLDILAKFS